MERVGILEVAIRRKEESSWEPVYPQDSRRGALVRLGRQLRSNLHWRGGLQPMATAVPVVRTPRT